MYFQKPLFAKEVLESASKVLFMLKICKPFDASDDFQNFKLNY